MWTKVKKQYGGYYATPARTSFGVQRSISGNQQAALIIPGGHTDEARCDIYSDGNGKLAFSFGKTGEYTIRKAGPQSLSRQVSIPQKFAKLFPFGTRDVRVTVDGGLIVVDTAQFQTARIAAE